VSKEDTDSNHSIFWGLKETGPYHPSVLRFKIVFPESYPDSPPLFTFNTDIFHPLVTPLSAYSYTAQTSTTNSSNANDTEILPPGGFSFRHGFPHWYSRSSNESETQTSGAAKSMDGFLSVPGSSSALDGPEADSKGGALSGDPVESASNPFQTRQSQITSIIDILHYVRSTFDSEKVLDKIPLESAANLGAWQAWQSHRRHDLGKLTPNHERKQGATISSTASSTSASGSTPRRPGEWNWEGVWEERVRRGIANSASEPALFGGSPEDQIKFYNIDDSTMDEVKNSWIFQSAMTSGSA
jgi:hypothetical protein